MAYPLRVLQRVGPGFIMPQGLKRRTGRNDLHFITFCCYHRKRLLDSVGCRDMAARILDEVRAKYDFSLVGYVIMPEHVHLLVSETVAVPPATIVQIFKQRVSRQMLALRSPELDGEPGPFWQRRYYDFNVYSQAKLREKLLYMDANPVQEPRCNILANGDGAVGRIMNWEMG